MDEPHQAMPVRAVLFDAVGTLIYAQPTVADAYREHGHRYGSRRTTAEITQRFAAALANQSASDAVRATSHARERDRWRRIVAHVFDDVNGDQEALFESLWNHFADPAHWALYDDVEPAWRALHGRGLTLGIASNFDERLVAVCRGHAPLSECKHVYCSAQLRHAKPSLQFFRAIERQLGLRPEEILLVGDDRAHDYDGARAAGWQAVLIQRNVERPPANAIRRLSELTISSTFHAT